MPKKLDIEKLRKIAALMDSPSEGERSVAMERARDMLAAAGKGFRDLPELLAARPSAPTPASTGFDGFSWEDISRRVGDDMERAHPGYKAEQARQKAEKARQAGLFKAATIRKYGGRQAVLADDDRQRAIEAASASLKRKEPKTFANGVFECETLDGWHDSIMDGDIPERVQQFIKAALPFPPTITDAKAELDYWDERDRELRAMYDDEIGDTCLSLPCHVRQNLVQDAFETGIRARSVEEIEMRQRYLVEGEVSMPEVERAVLLDLQHVIACPNGKDTPCTATERRAAVARLLSNKDAILLSDREIARRIGVSPQTVGNIRRRVSQRTASAVSDLFNSH